MAKQTGLGDGLIVDGIDLSGDTGGLQAIGASRPTTNVTGIDKGAQERIHLVRDGRIDWQSWFNPAGAHPELSTLPVADRILTYMRGRGLGSPAANMVARQLNYDGNRNTDGSLNFSLQARANGFGLEWGVQLTDGLETFDEPGSGDPLDTGTSTTAFGLQAYLHVVEFDGTNVTVSIEDDNGTISNGSFPQMTGVGSARIQTDRDESVTAPFNIAVAGTFNEVTLLVAVVVNRHAVVF